MLESKVKAKVDNIINDLNPVDDELHVSNLPANDSGNIPMVTVKTENVMDMINDSGNSLELTSGVEDSG